MTGVEKAELFDKLEKDAQTEGEAFERLSEITRYLRSDEGCPWDRVQTHESLRKGMIEETYEVINAINRKDTENLEEELGDFLLQGVFHGILGEEEKTFDLTSILNKVSNKLIFRHPHVFKREIAENQAETLDKALVKWENMKNQERSEKSQTEIMSDIAIELPALMRSCKIQKKARDVGFDWDDVKEAFDKVREETSELEEIYKGQDKDHIMEEVGDLLFSVVNVARFLGVDPEEALNFTSDKFIRRFGYVERKAGQQGRELRDMTLNEMDLLWEEAKSRERSTGEDSK